MNIKEMWDKLYDESSLHYRGDNPLIAYSSKLGNLNGLLYYTEIKQKILELCNINETYVNIIDAGCGLGYLSKISQKEFGIQNLFLGIDISTSCLKDTKKNYEHLINASITHMPLIMGCVPCMMSTEVLEHIPNYPDVIYEFYRVLTKKSLLVITTPNGYMTKFLNPYRVISNLFKKNNKPLYYYESLLDPDVLLTNLINCGFRLVYFEIAFPYVTITQNSIIQNIFNLIINIIKPWFFGSRQIIVVRK